MELFKGIELPDVLVGAVGFGLSISFLVSKMCIRDSNLPSAVLAVLYRANPEMRGRMDTAVLLALLFLTAGGMLWLLSLIHI